uniref:Large ribosomal subunit protein uL18c n=1 Tax=Vertebrata lanosa TaxID=1261582 RepID=A0A0B5W3E5_9FLOR|nr:50S ribosomal protein L18 [Vertebrata lanosa]AJH65915.1 50S ribosomal protein L18 [Vertebrata lanosa]
MSAIHMLKNKEKIRLYIFKSNKHIYAHLVDDKQKRIITSSSTISKDTKEQNIYLKNCTTAKIVGKNIGLKLKKLGIREIIFDRGNNIYHGQVQAVAEGAREEGIIF